MIVDALQFLLPHFHNILYAICNYRRIWWTTDKAIPCWAKDRQKPIAYPKLLDLSREVIICHQHRSKWIQALITWDSILPVSIGLLAHYCQSIIQDRASVSIIQLRWLHDSMERNKWIHTEQWQKKLSITVAITISSSKRNFFTKPPRTAPICPARHQAQRYHHPILDHQQWVQLSIKHEMHR